MPKLSVVIITRNEEKNIRACLESISWADEIIVVDDESADRTRSIAATFPGVTVFRRAMQHGYGPQKQFALQQASHEWVLSLDADERVSDELRNEIAFAIDSSLYDGYAVRRKNFVLGRFMVDRSARNVRLFRRQKGRFSSGRVHESVAVNGRIGVLRQVLVHYANSAASIGDMLRAANAYSTLSAQDLFMRGRRVSSITLFFYAFLVPPYLFFRLYIFKWHLTNGFAGFATSFFRGLEGFFVYAKLWELQRSRVEKSS